VFVVVEGPWAGARLFARGEFFRVPPELNPLTNADGRIVAPLQEAFFIGTIGGEPAGSPRVINEALVPPEEPAGAALLRLSDAAALNLRALRRIEATPSGRGARADLAGALEALDAAMAASAEAGVQWEISPAEVGELQLATEAALSDTRAAFRYLRRSNAQRRQARALIGAALARTGDASGYALRLFLPRILQSAGTN
jgi:hypothetical protein